MGRLATIAGAQWAVRATSQNAILISFSGSPPLLHIARAYQRMDPIVTIWCIHSGWGCVSSTETRCRELNDCFWQCAGAPPWLPKTDWRLINEEPRKEGKSKLLVKSRCWFDDANYLYCIDQKQRRNFFWIDKLSAPSTSILNDVISLNWRRDVLNVKLADARRLTRKV